MGASAQACVRFAPKTTCFRECAGKHVPCRGKYRFESDPAAALQIGDEACTTRALTC